MQMFILDLNTGIVEIQARDLDTDYPDEVLDAEWNPELDKLVPMETPALSKHEVEQEKVPSDWILGALSADLAP